jgi:predicted nucleotidyltransferase
VSRPRAEIEGFAQAYRAAHRTRIAAERERARRVLARLPALATLLREEFGVLRIGYFGSLRRRRLAEDSDVDLYVDRVRRGRYFVALDRAWRALEVPVDLVELESAPDSLRKAIAAEGVSIDG